ncbi:MBL fold metallo-hydrolase [Ostreiculturibacter nitratireducens]|uniref:MBL fold metallo-hydrolase n=1 Tax=Ostreiculturibacter nitratireducens TaxID=3075226 RepID=UPI0031B63A6C
MFRIAALLSCLALPVVAQERIPSHCIALAENAPAVEVLYKAGFGDALAEDAVRLSYVAHATFVLETAGGLTVATDYTGSFALGNLVPDVVTMNHAHETHWTSEPDARIPHVLEGWGPFGAGVEHYLDLGEMLIRNVSTDIRSFGGVEEKGNSIFVFEVAGLCIGHLGHLHQEPSPEQYAMLGRLDVVMAPVDGGYTLDLATMIRVLKRLRASIVIPMHWFGDGTLQAFLDGMEEEFAVERRGENSLEVSLRTLPSRPTVVVLRPGRLQ